MGKWEIFFLRKVMDGVSPSAILSTLSIFVPFVHSVYLPTLSISTIKSIPSPLNPFIHSFSLVPAHPFLSTIRPAYLLIPTDPINDCVRQTAVSDRYFIKTIQVTLKVNHHPILFHNHFILFEMRIEIK